MSSCVGELDVILQSMLGLKAPGVTSSKIASITALCNANIQVCQETMQTTSLTCITPADLTRPRIVRNRPHPTHLHTFQEGSCHTQARRSLRRRLCDASMG